jgi:hypothetical protein
MEEIRLYAIALAGIASGATLGAAIPTDTERKVRGGRTGWRPFSNQSIIGIVLNQVLLLAVLACLVGAIAIGILRVASAYPLGQNDRYLLAACLFVGAGSAKWARYRYWKAKDPWR